MSEADHSGIYIKLQKLKFTCEKPAEILISFEIVNAIKCIKFPLSFAMLLHIFHLHRTSPQTLKIYSSKELDDLQVFGKGSLMS